MSRDCTICLPEPCKTTEDLDIYSLQSPIFPFVLNCPPGSTCNPANVALLACCDEDVPVVIPQSASDTEALALLEQALADCARKQLFCGELDELPDPDSPIVVYFNDAATQTARCPDGTIFSYTVRAGTVIALSRFAANTAAARLARQRAVEHRVCLSALDGAICLDAAYSKKIKASGRYVAQFPATDFWSHVSGTLPTGLTFSGGFQTNGATLSGTPTVAGTYTFTIRFVVSTFGSPGYGDYMEKNYQIKVVGITNTSPLPDFTTDEFYSEELVISGSHDIDLETWRISSGSLPDGFTLSKRLISGTTEAMMTGFMFTVEVTFTVQVILANGIQGFKQVTCAKAFTLEDATEDLGTVTPNIHMLAFSFFDGGNPQPPGVYRIMYENGAMEYAACMPDHCWAVAAGTKGFHYRYFAPGLTDALFPASTNAFLTQPEAEAENAGKKVDFATTFLAAISMYLDDFPYGDNQDGSPNPTFRLFRLSLA